MSALREGISYRDVDERTCRKLKAKGKLRRKIPK